MLTPLGAQDKVSLMNTATRISSQRFLDEATVEAKRAAADYVVTLFSVSAEYDVVIDGHHSLAAAKADNVAPEYRYADGQLARDLSGELALSGLELFLESHYNDSAYYDVATGLELA